MSGFNVGFNHLGGQHCGYLHGKWFKDTAEEILLHHKLPHVLYWGPFPMFPVYEVHVFIRQCREADQKHTSLSI